MGGHFIEDFEFEKQHGSGFGYWVGSRSNGSKEGSLERLLSDRRSDLVIHGGVTDDNANYSFDDWALVELDGQYYLCQATGCSCPSPTETWGVESGPFQTVDAARQHILSDQYDGWTLPRQQLRDFLKLFDETEAKQKALVN